MTSIDQPGSTDIVNGTMTDLGTGSIFTYIYTVNAADGSTYIDGIANISLTGAYNGTGEIADPPSNASFTINTTVDTTAPIVALVGSGIISIARYSTFTDSGASWTDNVDGTGNILVGAYGAIGSFAVSGSVNTSVTGSYLLEYLKVDNAGNTGSVSRTVNVINGAEIGTATILPPTGNHIYSNMLYQEIGRVHITAGIDDIRLENIVFTNIGTTQLSNVMRSSTGVKLVNALSNIEVSSSPLISGQSITFSLMSDVVGASTTKNYKVLLDTTSTENYYGQNIHLSTSSGNIQIVRNSDNNAIVTDDSEFNSGSTKLYTLGPIAPTIGMIANNPLDTTKKITTLRISNPDTGTGISLSGVTIGFNSVYGGSFTGNICLRDIGSSASCGMSGTTSMPVFSTETGVTSTIPFSGLSGVPQYLGTNGQYIDYEIFFEVTPSPLWMSGDTLGFQIRNVEYSVGSQAYRESYSGWTNTTYGSGSDITAPIIIMNGSGIVTLEYATPYTELGSTWTDDVDGSGTIYGGAYGMPGSFNLSGSVNTGSVGSYSLFYVKVDNAGNTGSVSRTVNVVDTTAPVVSLVGSGVVNMTQSGVFTDQGATWSDAVDGTGSIGGYNSGSLDVNTAGTYVIGYVYVDAAGNTGSVSRTVNVIAPDLTAPIVSLVGVSPVSVEYASSFVDPGATWTDNVDGTGSIASFNSGSININVLGSYVIEYIYVDVGGNTGSVSRTVNVVDTTAPVVSLVGGNPISLILGSTYTESGALWTDNVDGSGSIVSPYSGSVNTGAIGSYILQYRQIDTSGNTGTISRTINVLGAPDITPPVVSLSGSGIINIEFGSVYTELGATWMDNVDGTGNTFGGIYGAPGSFTITGSVNTGILGGYTITYRKIDSSGNTGSMNRTVNVVDTTVPTAILQYSNTGMTNGTVTVTLTGASEPINILNNSGSNTYTFSSNGSFTFLYSDLSGNTGSSTATVANIDITPPMIVLNGSSNISVYQGSVYVDAGATANDNVSGNITNALSVSGSVNTSILGNYTLLYTVVDGVGNLAIPAVRTVAVIANIPVIETVTGGGGGGGSSSIGSMISYVNAVFESAPTRITTQISQISYGESSMTLGLPGLMRILREKIEKESARNYMEPANTVPAIKIVTSEKIGPNIVEMIEKGYIRNVKDLRLQAKISRAEFIKIISLMNGYTDEGQQYKTPYKDVSDNSEFARYIDFARSRSWINAKQEYFRPGDTISLWEATKIMRSITGGAIPKKDTDSQKSLNREEAINIISKELSGNEQG